MIDTYDTGNGGKGARRTRFGRDRGSGRLAGGSAAAVLAAVSEKNVVAREQAHCRGLNRGLVMDVHSDRGAPSSRVHVPWIHYGSRGEGRCRLGTKEHMEWMEMDTGRVNTAGIEPLQL